MLIYSAVCKPLGLVKARFGLGLISWGWTISVMNLVKILPVKSKQPTLDRFAILRKKKYEIFSQSLVGE